MSINMKSTSVTQGPGQKQPQVDLSQPKPKKTPCCGKKHLNSLWSVWYGLIAFAAQGYIWLHCVRRLVGFTNLQWNGQPPPQLEIQAAAAMLGAVALLLPLQLIAALLKVGNLANDGFKLGAGLNACAAGPRSSLLLDDPRRGPTGVWRSLWQHGGPTAPFIHMTAALCLLLPKLLMESRLIDGGHLSQELIWKTDLSFLVVNKDRLVVLSFMTTPTNSSTLPIPQPYVTIPPSTPGSIGITPAVFSNVTNTTEVGPYHASALGNITETPNTLNSYAALNATVSTTMEDLKMHVENILKYIFGSDPWDPAESFNRGGPVSMEFLNYGIALFIYGLRYAGVFWSTNKYFGLIFSFQLQVNTIHSLLAYTGMSILYKIQVVGFEVALPLLRHKTGINVNQSPFLLNSHVTLALYLLSGLLVLCSSLVLYLYGYGRFNSFLNTERDKRVIVMKDGRTSGGWSYFTHCAALCVLFALTVCSAPILYDYTVIYRGSLDATILCCIIAGIMHIFLWVVVWLILTIKQTWIFKLRITIGRAALRSARSVKLVTDVDLMSSNCDDDNSIQPLLIVGNGRTYTVAETSPKKAIMSVIQKSTLERKAKSSGSVSSELSNVDSEEQIYWLRPKATSPKPSDSTDKLAWFNRKMTSSGKQGQKVTFNDVPCTSISCNSEHGASLRLCGGPGQQGEPDDGDYATLRELPLIQDDTSDEGKLLACVRDGNVTYCASRDLLPPPPRHSMIHQSHASALINHPSPVTVHTDETQMACNSTPRFMRRADSGMPAEEAPVRSDSVSTAGSSPRTHPEPDAAEHGQAEQASDESSSGVHSSASSDHPNHNQSQTAPLCLDPSTGDPLYDSQKLIPMQRVAPQPTHSLYDRNGSDFSVPTSMPYISSPNPLSLQTDCTIPTPLENSGENTVIIRRKSLQSKIIKSVVPPPVINEEPFGRSTNMRMTSFTDGKDLRNMTSSSATLPHYPTQPIVTPQAFPNCSTMPMPLNTRNVFPAGLHSGNSCQSFARPHCTIPSHHNGIRVLGGVGRLPERIQFPTQTVNGYLVESRNRINGIVAGHHSFSPQVLQCLSNFRQPLPTIDSERDSANYSMVSSNESENNSMYVNVNQT